MSIISFLLICLGRCPRFVLTAFLKDFAPESQVVTNRGVREEKEAAAKKQEDEENYSDELMHKLRPVPSRKLVTFNFRQ
jgi:hypothetical protein